MTPYFFKQMRKRTSLCLVVVLTALAFSPGPVYAPAVPGPDGRTH